MSANESTEHPMQVTEPGTTQRASGRVKWFNNKAGYGFITVSGGDRAGEDVFVHHSALWVTQEQYKYLVQGEYVEFDWSETENEGQVGHKWQASDVRGATGGKLMCETRNEARSTRSEDHSNDGDREHDRKPRRPRNWKQEDDGEDWENARRATRSRGGGPRARVRDEDGVEWVIMRRKRPDGEGGGGGGGNRRVEGDGGNRRPRRQTNRNGDDS
jgi:CspA family cold shock protein